MKIVFFGTSDFVEPIRDVIKDKFELVASFTSPEQEIDKEKLENLNPDLSVVASFGKILKKEILDIPKYGSINIHPSLLPKYRGASPIQSTILNGDNKTGITIIKMDEEVDHGPILFQKETEITDNDTFETLSKRLFKLAADHLPQVLNDYVNGDLKPTPQDHAKATFTNLLKKEDGFIDIGNPPPPDKIKKMIRAYYPWPGAWFVCHSEPELAEGEESSLEGKIIKLLPEDKVQVEGKNPMSYKDFMNGYSEGKELLKKIDLLSN